MNRLQLVGKDLKATASRSVDKKYRSRYKHSSASRFFIPLHYEKNYAYPLLVWLHGPTGSEHEITQVMPHISVRNYVGVSPRGVVRHQATHTDGTPTWTWDQETSSIAGALDEVLQCIDEAKQRFNVSADRVFLAGTDAGGTMALRLALNNPHLFRGVASIGGAMPTGRNPLSRVQTARKLPVLLMNGRDSAHYSVDDVCADLRLLHAAGMSVAYRQYPCGHEVTTRMLADLNRWVMELVSGVSGEQAACDFSSTDPTRLRVRDCN